MARSMSWASTSKIPLAVASLVCGTFALFRGSSNADCCFSCCGADLRGLSRFLNRLDLRLIESCSLFPGQVIGVEGSNLDGKKLIANRLFDDARPLRPLSLNPPSPETRLKVLIAAGPYTAEANDVYRVPTSRPWPFQISDLLLCPVVLSIVCLPFYFGAG